MFTLGLAALAFVAFLVSVIADSRSFRNAVFLGLALALGTLGLADRLAGLPSRQGHLLLLGLVLLVALGPFLAACYFVANGVTMARRERLRPANLLPLVTGAGILAVIGLDLAADQTGSVKLGLLARKTGIRGQVTGARTAGYYWPTAMLREFAAVFLRYGVVNLGICLVLAVAPVAYALAQRT